MIWTPPTNPDHGDTVADVLTLEPGDAINNLSQLDSGGQAQLVALARDLGLSGPPSPRPT